MNISPLALYTTLAAVLGLLVGSFLNVVIYRLPRMLEQRWTRECAELQGQPLPGGDPLNLLHPRSRCPHCGHTIAWHENIPVLSYLRQRGQCTACGHPIGLRYPLVELACAGLFAACVWQFGWTPGGLAWCGFGATLLALGCIDWDTTLLPDDLTLPLLWAGLVASALQWTAVPLASAVWGAVAGYLSLWLVFWAFKLATGKEGMGYGDFKLFAALGAWLGPNALVAVILMASLTGAVVGLMLKARQRLREGGYVPFGPFLAAAGLLVVLFGPGRILSLIGLTV